MTDAHDNTRLEALCDAVFAIAMTLLILDVKVPSPASITTTSELWHALWHLAPSAFAFILSFSIILITWVNHHATLKLIEGSSASFIYANGFLLLTVVAFPFPTGLLGDFLWTDHAAPAVMLYDAVLAVQAIAWVLVLGAALKNGIGIDDDATSTMRMNRRHGYWAFLLYALLAIAAWWVPLSVAIVTTVSWIFWLVLGLRLKHRSLTPPARDTRSV